MERNCGSIRRKRNHQRPSLHPAHSLRIVSHIGLSRGTFFFSGAKLSYQVSGRLLTPSYPTYVQCGGVTLACVPWKRLIKRRWQSWNVLDQTGHTVGVAPFTIQSLHLQQERTSAIDCHQARRHCGSSPAVCDIPISPNRITLSDSFVQYTYVLVLCRHDQEAQ